MNAESSNQTGLASGKGKLITRTSHAIEIDDQEYELRLKPEHGLFEPTIKKLPDGRMAIGYLLPDSDCANPLTDCDGMGRIYSLSNRHSNHISLDDAKARLESNPFAVALSYFEHGLCKWGVEGTMGGMPDFNWDGVSFAGIWEPDDCALDEAKRRAIVYSTGEIARLDILRGPKFLATHYKNGGKDFTKHRFPEWGTAFAWLSTKTKRKTATKIGIARAAQELAGEACEQYTAWCNGDCWGVVVVTCNPDGSMIESDECWGYIGHDYAEQTLDDQMAGVS